MGDLSEEELESIERSLGGPQLVATSKSETCRMVTELRRHRAAQTASAERVRAVVRESTIASIIDSALFYTWSQLTEVSHQKLIDAIADRVAAQLTMPPIVSAADRAEIEQWLVSRAQDGHACEALDRVLYVLDAAPPGHVWPVPYGLGPDDVDALTELAVHAEMAGWPRAREALDRILAMHRAPGAAP